MNKSSSMVRGFGVKGMDYPTWENGKHTKEYQLWQNMLERCTEKWQAKNASYKGVTCSENFKSYTFFYEWCHSQKGFNCKDDNGENWRLDKDILVKGNKVYSEDACCFVPLTVNSLLISRRAKRGDCPIGVYWDKSQSKFKSQCNVGTGVQKHLGVYATKEDAFKSYKTFKEAQIRLVTEQYKDLLDSRAYGALMNYTVEITD